MFDTNQNIYLIGFMGSGKSTIAPMLAKKLKRGFFDTDAWIENNSGISISTIFAEFGEHYFRELERQSIQIVTQMKNMVVSLGGGAILNSENWIQIKQTGVTIYLKCSANLLWQRLKNSPDSRPLLTGDESQKKITVKKLLTEREPYYSRADLIYLIKGNDSTDDVVNFIVCQLEKIL